MKEIVIFLILCVFTINVHATSAIVRNSARFINELAKIGVPTGVFVACSFIFVLLIVVTIVHELKKHPWSYTSKYLKDNKNLERADSPKLVNGKEYNEQGILTREVQLPEKYKEYYDNGNVKLEAIGLIVKENGIFSIKEGSITEFDVKGNILHSTIYKDFKRMN